MVLRTCVPDAPQYSLMFFCPDAAKARLDKIPTGFHDTFLVNISVY